jgi:hypothetical protein
MQRISKKMTQEDRVEELEQFAAGMTELVTKMHLTITDLRVRVERLEKKKSSKLVTLDGLPFQ